jgi:hypothetical protein
MLARVGTGCRTLKSPPSRKLAMALREPVRPGAFERSDGGSMRMLPHDGETASIVRGKEAGTFYLFNADLVHVYIRSISRKQESRCQQTTREKKLTTLRKS